MITKDKTVNFFENQNSFSTISTIKSPLLYGNPELYKEAFLTICITVYKRIDTLGNAISSALKQNTNHSYKIIIIDDYPNPSEENPTLELIQSFNNDKISYYRHEKNLGMAGTWNRCGELSNTPYFCILHDDDLLKPDYVEETYNFIKSKKPDCIVNAYETVNTPFSTEPSKINKLLRKFQTKTKKLNSLSANMFLNNYYGPPTCGITFNRESFLESGGFNQEYFPSLDWYFLIYFANKYNLYLTRKSLSKYVWAANESLKPETQQAFTDQRYIILKSLPLQSKTCKFLNGILKNDFNKKAELPLNSPENLSVLYKIIAKIYYIKYGF